MNKDLTHKKPRVRNKRKSDSYVCEECGIMIMKTEKNARHKYDKHISRHRVQQFSCPCEIEFKTSIEKEHHMKVDHMGWFGCPGCMQSFKNW